MSGAMLVGCSTERPQMMCARCGTLFNWGAGHDCVVLILDRLEKLEAEVQAMKDARAPKTTDQVEG